MSATGVIYLIVNTVNNKKYVGQTIRPLKARIREHFGNSSGCIRLKNAVKKYGKDSFKIIPLKWFACSDSNKLRDLLDYYEEYYIEYFDSIKSGYNCTTGGHSPRLSEITRDKISTANKISHNTAQYKKLASEQMKGNRNALGSKHSAETIQRMKIAQNNRSEEWRKNISDSLKGKKRPGKAISQYDLDGNFIKSFEKVADVQQEFNVYSSHFGQVANGKRKSAFGFIWKWN